VYRLNSSPNNTWFGGDCIAPSGRPITLKGIAIYRVQDRKLMERWVVSDLYGVLEESGALSAH